MMDDRGHVKLIDFGQAVTCEGEEVRRMQPVGTLSIMPPELLLHHIGGRCTDWWAYGVLSFEMLTGKSPWSSLTDNSQIFQDIINASTDNLCSGIPQHYSVVRSFLSCLLTVDHKKRLANTKDIKTSAFFKGVIDWDLCSKRQNTPAFIPNIDCPCLSFEEREMIMAEHWESQQRLMSTNSHHDARAADDGKMNTISLGYPDASQFLSTYH
jgi:serine/threonine protein kinase